MKIQCVLIRQGGTKVDIDNVQYHFEPLPDGAHVADVENEDHVDRFLAIAEGYKLYRGDLAPVGAPEAIEPSPVVIPVFGEKPVVLGRLNGSDVHESSYEIAGHVYSLTEIINIAFGNSEMSVEEWNDLPDDERLVKIDIALDDLAEAAEKQDKAVAPKAPAKKTKK
jgi:hypothetical protein